MKQTLFLAATFSVALVAGAQAQSMNQPMTMSPSYGLHQTKPSQTDCSKPQWSSSASTAPGTSTSQCPKKKTQDSQAQPDSSSTATTPSNSATTTTPSSDGTATTTPDSTTPH